MLFDYITPNNMIVFKAIHKEYDINFNDPSWFTTNAEANIYAQSYNSTKIIKVQIKSGLKLINITSKIFHDDLMNKVLLNVPDEFNRNTLLIPLGIPDLNFQKQSILNLKKININLDNCVNRCTNLNDDIKLFGNHHRFSYNVTDKSLINFIKCMYPDYQGIISSKNWPSCFHDNNFPMELCIFNPKDNCTLIESKNVKKGGKKFKIGGNYNNPRLGYYNYNKLEQLSDEELKKLNKDEEYVLTFKNCENPSSSIWLE